MVVSSLNKILGVFNDISNIEEWMIFFLKLAILVQNLIIIHQNAVL